MNHLKKSPGFLPNMQNVKVREANAKDANSIALLHALSWKSTYRNLVSDEYLDNNLEEERTSYWMDKLNRLLPNDFVLVAETESFQVIGFIAVLDKPEMGYEAFIDNLHVHPHHKGLGLGKTLMRMASIRLKERGVESAYLFVLNGNYKAEEFYKMRGGKLAEITTVHFGGSYVLQTRVVWDKLDGLTRP